MNDALKKLPPAERRRLLALEAKRRKAGDWGPWEAISLTGTQPTRPEGWLHECSWAFRCQVFAVLLRQLPEQKVIHLAVSSLSGIRPTWHEMQRIKNDLVGAKLTAVEVYPPQDEVVDGADMFHIWVLPGRLPFSLSTRPGRAASSSIIIPPPGFKV